MKNNKGMTIIEIVISIALISLVMIFLFRVLITLTKDDQERIDTNANVLASTVAKTIHKDFYERDLNIVVFAPENRITIETTTEGLDTLLYFGFGDDSYKEVIINEDTIGYLNGTEKEIHKIKDFIKVGGDTAASGVNIIQDFTFNLSEIKYSLTEYDRGTGIYDGFFNVTIPFSDGLSSYNISIDYHYTTDNFYAYINNINETSRIGTGGATNYTPIDTNSRKFELTYTP